MALCSGLGGTGTGSSKEADVSTLCLLGVEPLTRCLARFRTNSLEARKYRNEGSTSSVATRGMNSVEAILRLSGASSTSHTFGTRGFSFPKRTVAGSTTSF